MNEPVYHLTVSEWHLMECLWNRAPCSGKDATAYMAKSVGWSRSTTLTMMRRMTEKHLIECSERDGIFVYNPMIDRQAATMEQTQSFLDRVYHGSLSMMLSAFTEKQALSSEERDALYALLKEAEKND